MRRWYRVSFLATLGLVAALAPTFAADEPDLPARFELPTMKTSIFIGSVTLVTGAFTRGDDSYTSTYDAKVSPWSFWSESGTISLDIDAGDYERLRAGETIELTGEAHNRKGKLRAITARAEPTDATTGKIKVRIIASGSTLVFNGTYTVTPEATGAAVSVHN